MTTERELEIKQGETLVLPIRWETSPIVRKAISAIDLSTGCPRLTIAGGHGLVDGWRVMRHNVACPKEINSENDDIEREANYTPATVVSTTIIELNQMTVIGWKAYTSGGFIQYNTPHDLAGYAVRMKIRTRKGGDILASSEVADDPLNVLSLVADNTAKTITLTIDADDAAALNIRQGWYDIEAVSPSGRVWRLMEGPITFSKEVTSP